MKTKFIGGLVVLGSIICLWTVWLIVYSFWEFVVFGTSSRGLQLILEFLDRYSGRLLDLSTHFLLGAALILIGWLHLTTKRRQSTSEREFAPPAVESIPKNR